jgi:hypothetical protein
MSTLTIEVEGIDKLLKKYGRVEGLKLLREPIIESLAFLVDDLATYPSPPPGSTYRRTGTLGRFWTSAVPEILETSQGISGRYGNNLEYAPYVQDEELQAGIHRSRWLTDDGAIKKNEQKIIDKFETFLVKSLE